MFLGTRQVFTCVWFRMLFWLHWLEVLTITPLRGNKLHKDSVAMQLHGTPP